MLERSHWALRRVPTGHTAGSFLDCEVLVIAANSHLHVCSITKSYNRAVGDAHSEHSNLQQSLPVACLQHDKP